MCRFAAQGGLHKQSFIKCEDVAPLPSNGSVNGWAWLAATMEAVEFRLRGPDGALTRRRKQNHGQTTYPMRYQAILKCMSEGLY